MEKYHKFIKDNPKVEMIHVSYDESVAAATRWAKKENFPWLSVLPGKKKASGLGKFEATDSVPEYHLINRHGETLVRPAPTPNRSSTRSPPSATPIKQLRQTRHSGS